MPPVDKPKHKRRVPKRYERGKFSNEVRQDIYTRANGICEYCQCRQGIELHHVKPKSRAGRGVYTNGILIV